MMALVSSVLEIVDRNIRSIQDLEDAPAAVLKILNELQSFKSVISNVPEETTEVAAFIEQLSGSVETLHSLDRLYTNTRPKKGPKSTSRMKCSPGYKMIASKFKENLDGYTSRLVLIANTAEMYETAEKHSNDAKNLKDSITTIWRYRQRQRNRHCGHG